MVGILRDVGNNAPQYLSTSYLGVDRKREGKVAIIYTISVIVILVGWVTLG